MIKGLRVFANTVQDSEGKLYEILFMSDGPGAEWTAKQESAYKAFLGTFGYELVSRRKIVEAPIELLIDPREHAVVLKLPVRMRKVK